MIVAVDWDRTLVDENGDWLPGAPTALRWMQVRHKVVVHSSRASYDKGKTEIEDKLRSCGIKARVYPKPEADLYIDDKALRFPGSWGATLNEIRMMR